MRIRLDFKRLNIYYSEAEIKQWKMRWILYWLDSIPQRYYTVIWLQLGVIREVLPQRWVFGPVWVKEEILSEREVPAMNRERLDQAAH